MKRLLLALLLLVGACAPSFWGSESSVAPTHSVQVYPVEGGWGFDVKGSGVFVANSNALITEFRGDCKYLSTIAGGEKKAVRCDVPGKVELITTGKILYSVVPLGVESRVEAMLANQPIALE